MVAILRLDDLASAKQLVQSLLEGGIRLIEFTLTNPESPRIIKTLAEEIEDFQTGEAAIGLGSVRNRQEAVLAVESGAQFVVSPILSRDVIEICREGSISVMPGAFSPTEIYQAWEWGADVVKVFPAKGLGPGFLRDVLAPMPFLKLMPTGGIGLDNMDAYFQAGAVGVGVGGSLVDKKRIAEGRWSEIQQIARTYADAARAGSN